MKRKHLFAITCTACCLALFSSCAGLGAGVARNYKNKKAGDEVREQVKIGDDVYTTAERLREAGWHVLAPSYMDHAKTRLWCYVKVGKHSFFTILGELYGSSFAEGEPAYVIIKASPEGEITSVE